MDFLISLFNDVDHILSGIQYGILAVVLLFAFFVLIFSTFDPEMPLIGDFLLDKLFFSSKKHNLDPNSEMIGSIVNVLDWSGDKGRICYNGEIWRAVSKEPLDLKSDDTVLITEVDKLLVTVAR